MVKAIGLFSGGLDSILAVKLLQEQHIEIELVSFVTPFFNSRTAEKYSCLFNIPMHTLDFTNALLQAIKSPKHGYGKNMNPCIDCHALMFRQAGSLMEQTGADFLFSGEVLGERPMSQNRQSLQVVARQSGFEDLILRPLSAKLLPVTKPESSGLVNREQLLDIKGRSRKKQMELTLRFGITEYPTPAGGCLLTDKNFSNRLRDLLTCEPDPTRRSLELLSEGRHFRITDREKIIIGKNEDENERLLSLSRQDDIILTLEDIPGPIVLITPGTKNSQTIELAAAMCVEYSDAPKIGKIDVSVFQDNIVYSISTSACHRENLKDYSI